MPNPPKSKNSKQPSGKMSVGEALDYVKNNKLNAKEAFEFLKKHNSKALVIMNPNKWERVEKNPNYKEPLTEDDYKSYQNYNEQVGKLKQLAGDEILTKYLNDSGFQPHSKSQASMKGLDIINQAKRRGAKVEDIGNGMYKIYDDETTFRDTDNSFKGDRIINLDSKYARNTYKKGNDLVNVYSFAEGPKYSGRVPTPQEVDEYKSGRTYLKAATPEMKVYYADKYFDPNNPDAEDKTFYGSQTNMEDIDRRRYAESLGKEVKVEYSNWQNKEAKKRALLNKFSKLASFGGNKGDSRFGNAF
jgi:hypothetical protein